MTDHASLLRQIRAEARPYIEQWLEIGEVFAGFRKLAADNDLDWGVIKALIKAEVQDEQDEEGGSKRVTKIIERADCASAYADMLGLGSAEEKNNFCADPPHDEDGVLIEDIPRSIAQGDVIAPAPGAGGPTTAMGDAGEITDVTVRVSEDASPINSNAPQGVASGEGGSCALGASPSPPINSENPQSPSNRDVSADGKASSAAASQGQAAHVGTDSETLASHEGHSTGEGTAVLSPINSEHDAQREATDKTTSPAPVAESPASSQEPCTHGSGAVQDRCESTAPPFPDGIMPDLPKCLDRRTAA